MFCAWILIVFDVSCDVISQMGKELWLWACEPPRIRDLGRGCHGGSADQKPDESTPSSVSRACRAASRRLRSRVARLDASARANITNRSIRVYARRGVREALSTAHFRH